MVDRSDYYIWSDDDIVFGEDDLEGIDIPEVDETEDEDEETEKSYHTTQGAFLSDLKSLVKQAIEGNGVIGRYSFGIRMRNLLKDYGYTAYRDGMAAGGVFVDELDPDEETDYRSIFIDQSSYIPSFSDDIYVSKAVTLNNLDNRVAMWGKSLQPFTDAGTYSADKNGMYVWVRNPLKKSCVDCKRLEGQVHRFKTWKLSGWMPKSNKLFCFGGHCGCRLEKSNEKARGRF